MLNKSKILTKFLQTTKLKKKKREKRKNTDNICIWYYQVQILALTKAASILVPIYKRFGFASNQ
jgi:hypothetical protein